MTLYPHTYSHPALYRSQRPNPEHPDPDASHPANQPQFTTSQPHRPHQLSQSLNDFCFCLVFHPSFPLILFTQSSLLLPCTCTLANGYRDALMVT